MILNNKSNDIDNLHCRFCVESSCAVEFDGKCEMIRNYLRNREFHNSVSCLFVEGVELMSIKELYKAIKAEWNRTLPVVECMPIAKCTNETPE